MANHIPLENMGEGTNAIKVTAVDVEGNVEENSIDVYAEMPETFVTLTADTESGISHFETTLNVDTRFDFNESSITHTGPGFVEYVESTSDEYRVRISGAGLYYFTVEVTDSEYNTYEDTIAILVFDEVTLDGLLKQKWANMRQSLIDGDISKAVTECKTGRRDAYNYVFNEVHEQLAAVLPDSEDLELIEVSEGKAKYVTDFQLEVDGMSTTYSTYVIFIKDADGIWRIQFF